MVNMMNISNIASTMGTMLNPIPNNKTVGALAYGAGFIGGKAFYAYGAGTIGSVASAALGSGAFFFGPYGAIAGYGAMAAGAAATYGATVLGNAIARQISSSEAEGATAKTDALKDAISSTT
jgi:hypothetical protein